MKFFSLQRCHEIYYSDGRLLHLGETILLHFWLRLSFVAKCDLSTISARKKETQRSTHFKCQSFQHELESQVAETQAAGSAKNRFMTTEAVIFTKGVRKRVFPFVKGALNASHAFPSLFIIEF